MTTTGGPMARSAAGEGARHLRGAVAERLTIEPGGYVLLSGSCPAAITIHEGGLLEIAGTLEGRVVRNDGEIWAMSGSTIHGRALSSAGFFIPPDPEHQVVIDSPRFRLTGTGDLLDTFAAVQLELSYDELYAGQATGADLTDRLAAHGLTPWTWDAGISGADGRLLQSDTLFVRR